MLQAVPGTQPGVIKGRGSTPGEVQTEVDGPPRAHTSYPAYRCWQKSPCIAVLTGGILGQHGAACFYRMGLTPSCTG